MQKKIIRWGLVLSTLVLLALTWLFILPATTFPESKKIVYIKTGQTDLSNLFKLLEDSNCIRTDFAFKFLADKMDMKESLKPGKYEIRRSMSLLGIVRMFKNNQQSFVRLTITKIRTKEQLASLVGKKFELDSLAFLQYINNNDSLKTFQVTSSNFMSLLLPESYDYYWNSSPEQIIIKWKKEHDLFWNEERKQLAAERNLTPETSYILASIIEEETNAKEEKGQIASVYLNRIAKGMPLQADPTVKFALRNFGLKRIYEKHLLVESPYNTYRYKGWPPGPICTPSKESLEAVLSSPSTQYLFFVAKSDFSGRHDFSSTYSEHLIKAKAFQDAQNVQEATRKMTSH